MNEREWTPIMDEDREYSTVADSRGDWIASCGPRNAHLIAAAPDLYEALEATLRFVENTESELGIILGSGDKARAALAKAKGETPHA